MLWGMRSNRVVLLTPVAITEKQKHRQKQLYIVHQKKERVTLWCSSVLSLCRRALIVSLSIIYDRDV